MRIPSIQPLIIWLCLLSFGIDFVAHSIPHGFLDSSSTDHGDWILDGIDHKLIHLSESLDHPAADHTDPLQHSPHDNLPSDTDHDQTHHLTIQLRLVNHLDTTLYPKVFRITQMFTAGTAVVVARPVYTPDRVVYLDIYERMRTVRMTV